MEQRDTTTLDQGAGLRRKSKVWQYASANSEQRKSKTMSKEDTDLATHVEICAIRYEGIEGKMNDFDQRLTKIERDVSDLKVQTATGFSEIKLLLERQNSSKQTQMIATFGTIITAILAFVGYLITK
jgi:hypothetical protein